MGLWMQAGPGPQAEVVEAAQYARQVGRLTCEAGPLAGEKIVLRRREESRQVRQGRGWTGERQPARGRAVAGAAAGPRPAWMSEEFLSDRCYI